MRKVFLLLASAFSCLTAIQATNNIVVSGVTVQQGGTGIISVALNNDKEYTAFSMKLTLPEGISYESVTKGARMTDTHSLSGNGSTGMITCLSTANDPFTGTSGELFTITVSASSEAAVGGTLQATLTEVNFSTTSAEETFESVTFDITIGEPDDGRIHFDETSTKLPTYTAGDKGDVTVKRTIKAGQWSTIVMPFNLTKANATAVFGSDVEFAKFNGFEVDYGDDDENVIPLGITINFTSYSIPARGNLAGGTPVLIKTSKDISEIKLDQVTLAGSVLNEEKADEYGTPGKFIGTLTKTMVPEDGLFISDNKFWYSTGATNIKAFRGWFELGAVLDKETDFSVKMLIDDFETKVDGIGIRDAAGTIYDLGGRKITKPQQRGVYIVNGQKVIVK